MTTHGLKCWPEFFQPMFDGTKTFDLRKNDRDYAVGDILLLREWSPDDGQYTGRELNKRVVYVLHGVGQGAIEPLQGLHHRYVILGLADV